MERIELGRSGIEVSEVILGCGSIGGIGSAAHTMGKGLTDVEAFDMMDAGVALGINVLATANSYAGGHSERVVGRWLAQRQPPDVLVATKVGILSGKYQPGSAPPAGSRLAVRPDAYQRHVSAEVLARVGHLVEEAGRLEISPAGLALAWLVSSPDVTAPLVAPRRREQFEAVGEALNCRLDPDQRDRISSLFTG
jgi:aryl-alcohol dehydrogenase-like predicted oxidoreductase